MVINSINNHNTNKLSITIITDYIIFIFMMMIIINANSSHKRRKCRSQTSDTMDRWNSRGGKSQRRKRRKNIREEKSQKKEDAGGRKVRRVANHCVFPVTWLVGSEGWKVGSLKRRVRSHLCRCHLGRWEMKNCTLLWHEAHVEVKLYKPHQVRTTFGSWDVEKVHTMVARSTCWSQNVQNTACTRHFWMLKRRLAWQAQGIAHLVKSEQNVRVLQNFQKRWQACGIWRDEFSVAGAVQETC